MTAWAMYILFAAGALGLYCLMPRGEKGPGLIGGVLGTSALIGLIVLFATKMLPSGGTGFYFCLFALVAILSAVRVITHDRPVYSALYFVVVVLAVAAMLVLLQAEFLAAALVIVYAGAILITYVFVIMLAQQSGQPIYDRRAREPFLAVTAGFMLTAAIAGNVGAISSADLAPAKGAVLTGDSATTAASLHSSTEKARPAGGAMPPGNTLLVGREVMTRFVVVLELSGVLLLIAMVGAIALSRKKMPSEGPAPVALPLGEVGRHVKPF